MHTKRNLKRTIFGWYFRLQKETKPASSDFKVCEDTIFSHGFFLIYFNRKKEKVIKMFKKKMNKIANINQKMFVKIL